MCCCLLHEQGLIWGPDTVMLVFAVCESLISSRDFPQLCDSGLAAVTTPVCELMTTQR